MKRYLDDPAYAHKIRLELAGVQGKLGDKGATKRVAAALEEYFK